jgi:23S rRNA pseudouridine2604 synthase
MSEGVRIDEGKTLPCKMRQTGRHTFNIILIQGLNRQIRKMCEALGYKVTSLQRVRIMHVKLDKLVVGKWRYLSEPEIEALYGAVGGSSKEAGGGRQQAGGLAKAGGERREAGVSGEQRAVSSKKAGGERREAGGSSEQRAVSSKRAGGERREAGASSEQRAVSSKKAGGERREATGMGKSVPKVEASRGKKKSGSYKEFRKRGKNK